MAYINNPIMIRDSESFNAQDSIIGLDSTFNSKLDSP